MISVKKHAGVTLIEILLVLVISAALIVFGLRVYQTYRLDVEAQQLRSNVDALFLIGLNYYRSNCIANYPGETVTLNTVRTNPVPIKLPASSVSFLPNPLVDPNTTIPPMSGYGIQFNPIVLTREVNINESSPPSSISSGTVLLWKIGVSVKMRSSVDAKAYRDLLGATCLSSYDGTFSAVKPCTSSTQTGEYLVWERMPSSGNIEVLSDLPYNNANVTQFMQQYTTVPILSVTSGGYALDFQYYLCGG